MWEGRMGRNTLRAVWERVLYCSRTRSRSVGLGILNMVMRSTGVGEEDILVVVCRLSFGRGRRDRREPFSIFIEEISIFLHSDTLFRNEVVGL
jgi:hypothetical protein